MSNVEIKIFEGKCKTKTVGYVSLQEYEGEPHLVVVDEDGEVIVYLARIAPDGLYLSSFAKNDYIATTKDAEYVVIKRED